MSHTDMSITRALVELKTLDKRLQKLTQEAFFVGVKGELRKRDERIKKAQADYDKIRDLRNRRHKIKSAIVVSNATTKVTICGQTMSKAEAIEMKSSIKHDKALLSQLRRQFSDAQKQLETENQRVQRVLENSLASKTSDEGLNVEEYSRQYMKMNGIEMDDPIKVQEKIEKLDKFITDFEGEVDFILSESNAVTTIRIDE